jgi:hypothetical protein
MTFSNSDQLVAEANTYSKDEHIHALCGVRTRDSSYPAVSAYLLVHRTATSITNMIQLLNGINGDVTA